jgi:hypothetical protein
MATHTEPSPLEQLTALLDQHGRDAAEWRKKLPALRAKTAAAGAILDRLARTWPTDPAPRRGYADVVLAAPSKDWAEKLAAQLRVLLPAARVELGAGPEQRSNAPLLFGFTVSCQVSLPGVPGTKTNRQVRAALATIKGLEVDYSEPLDLIVVSPSG